jgi:methylenetetrahydrofolate dehydrogenase (NADP+)/methenyltetrahydrofolate cyclohydrolase
VSDHPEGTELLDGRPVAAGSRERTAGRVRSLRDEGTTPTLATIAMTNDPASERFLELKQEACEEVGIAVRPTLLAPDAPAERCYDAIETASENSDVDAVFVQVPLPNHVEEFRVRESIAPAKDVDCFHSTNLGRLVDGDPVVKPATAGGILTLLDAYDIALAGRDLTVVGRSTAIGRPLANLLWRKAPGHDATVTACHSFTSDLIARTRQADVLITACGEPRLVDGAMLSPDTVVVDASATRVETDDGREVVGDVDFESARPKASAITPVPGGVGPMTLASLLENVVTLAERRA